MGRKKSCVFTSNNDTGCIKTCVSHRYAGKCKMSIYNESERLVRYKGGTRRGGITKMKNILSRKECNMFSLSAVITDEDISAEQAKNAFDQLVRSHRGYLEKEYEEYKEECSEEFEILYDNIQEECKKFEDEKKKVLQINLSSMYPKKELKARSKFLIVRSCSLSVIVYFSVWSQ